MAFNQDYAGGNAQVFTDVKEMFDRLDLDLLYISLPPYAHAHEVEWACQRGIHFLIEKPIALTMALANQMAEQVRASGVKTQVGFMFRHGLAAQRLKQQMAARGPDAYMVARYACNSLHRPWWRVRSQSGGQLVEQIIHLLDMTRFFLGEPVQVFSAQANLFHRDVPDYTVEDASATTIQFSGGGLAVVSATNGAIPNRWDYDWRVMAKGLTADFTDANTATFHDTSGAQASAERIESSQDLYLAETLDLLAAIRDDRPALVPIEEGVRTLQLALAAQQSADQNAPVNLAALG
jgi:predicted dehydrogenase